MLVFFIFELFEILDIVPITRNISQGINNNPNKIRDIINTIKIVQSIESPPNVLHSTLLNELYKIQRIIIDISTPIVIFIIFITITTI